jgi:CRP-like cAMP-binding protein
MRKVRSSEARGTEGRVMPIKRTSFNPKPFFAKVGEGGTIGRYDRDQTVFSQRDPADSVFYIQSGKVKVTVVSKQGKEAVVAILGTNEFIGEGCLAEQAKRMATVTTMTESVIVRLEKAAIVRLFLAGPSASKQTSSNSYSIRVRNVLPGCSCCWRILARTTNQSRLSRKSARKLLRR